MSYSDGGCSTSELFMVTVGVLLGMSERASNGDGVYTSSRKRGFLVEVGEWRDLISTVQ